MNVAALLPWAGRPAGLAQRGRCASIPRTPFGMDFSLTSDQLLIRDTVRQFMETEMRPVIREYEREHTYPVAELRKLGELGCCGMMIPEEGGGAGQDTIASRGRLWE